MELVLNLDNFGARAAYKEALALDPGFAAAWQGLAAVFYNLGFGDSNRAAIDSALAHRERLGGGKWFLEIVLANRRGDFAAALAAREQAYRSGGPPTNYSAALATAGRDSEAVAVLEEYGRRTPFGLRPIDRLNLSAFLAGLGRIDEARRMAETLTGESRTRALLRVARATLDWPGADSLARSLVSGHETTRCGSERSRRRPRRMPPGAACGRRWAS